MTIKHLLYSILFLFFFILCGVLPSTDSESEAFDTATLNEQISSSRNFFYNLLLPTDLIDVFKIEQLEYNEDWLNPTDNYINYSTNNKKAINLGVYGVDFGYTSMNNRVEQLKAYAQTISRLAKDLGIPEEHINNALTLSLSMTNNDSLYQATCQLYEIIDSYLNQNERQSISALIILGGWVEAMYLVTNLAEENPSPEAYQKVGSQKYALQSLISYLSTFQDDMLIANYLVLLNALNKVYEQIDIYYKDSASIVINAEKRIINTENSEVNMNREQFMKIKDLIIKIRNHMVQ